MSKVTVNNQEDVLHALDKMDKHSFKVGFKQQIFGYFFSPRVEHGDYEFFLPDSISKKFKNPSLEREEPCAGMCWSYNSAVPVMNILDVAWTSRTSGVAAVEFIKPFNPTAGWNVFSENAEIKEGWHPVVACIKGNECFDCVKAGHLCFDARQHFHGDMSRCDYAKMDFAFYHKGEFVCHKNLSGLNSKVKFFGKNFGMIDIFSSIFPKFNPDVDEWLKSHCFPGLSWW